MSAESPRGRRPDPLSASRTTVPARSREMGQWSFLTWSFFLSQVLSAEQFLGSAAAANAATPEATPQHELTGDQANANARSAAAGGIGSHGEAPGGPALTILGGHLADVPLLNVSGIAMSPGAGIGSLGSAGRLVADGGQPVGPVGGLFGLASMDATSDAGAAHHDAETGSLPALAPLGIGLGGSELNLGSILSPVVGVVGDVSSILPPVAAVLDVSLQTVGNVADATGELVQSLATGLSAATASLPGLLGTALPQTLGVIAGETAGVVGVVHSTFDLLHDALAGANGGLQGASGSVAQNALASGGTLAFPELPVGLHTAVDTLFSPLGGYTDYNLSLQNLGLGAGGAAPASHGGGDLLTALLDHVTLDPHADGANGHGHTSGFNLPGALDEMHLRGLGDGIAA